MSARPAAKLATLGFGGAGIASRTTEYRIERYGAITVVRPEPQAMWSPADADWDPHATFVPGSDEEGGGRWIRRRRSRRRG